MVKRMAEGGRLAVVVRNRSPGPVQVAVKNGAQEPPDHNEAAGRTYTETKDCMVYTP